jgi:hypothetical protein
MSETTKEIRKKSQKGSMTSMFVAGEDVSRTWQWLVFPQRERHNLFLEYQQLCFHGERPV